MPILSRHQNKLILAADSEILRSNLIKSFFVNKLGFVFDKSSSQYLFDKKIDSDLVETIVEYFNELDIKLDLDNRCLEIYKKNIDSRANFELLGEKGNEIKTRNYKSLEVPFMDSNKNLKPYQIMPVIHAVEMGNVANFSVPGSGKTWMAYSTYFLHKSKGEIDKLLVVGPLSSFRPWENEYKEITGKEPPSVRISGSPNKRRDIFTNSHFYEIFLVSYDTARIERDSLIELLQENNFMLVVDESHHIKNPQGVAANAILQLSRYAKKRVVLSGTPMPNRIEDVWTQFTFLYPNEQLLGSFDAFRYELTKENPLLNLRNRLAPYYSRISKNMLDLPQPRIVRMRIPMSKIQRRIYNAIKGFIRENDPQFRDDFLAVQRWRKNCIVYLIEASTDSSLLTKNSHYHEQNIEGEGLPIQTLIEEYEKFENPNKLVAVKKLAEESLSKGNKIIVWCSFIASIKKLTKMLETYKPIPIWGEVPKDYEEDENYNREKEIERFKTSRNHNLLIANPASLAESISLHKVCHHAIYLDRTFNAGHYMQSLERIHRIGLDPNTKTRYTICLSENSIDEVIDNRLEEKKERMLSFLNEDAFGELNLDLDYDNPYGEEDELAEDYRKVFEYISKD